MQGNKFVGIFAVLISVVLFLVHYVSVEPPSVKPASAPVDEFPGARAYAVLEKLLKENKPHPVGSPQNKIVKQRIMDELDSLGIEYTEQATWAVSKPGFGRCAFVENIVAIIPGELPGPYVTLMAHYDSVPMSPGAGDDGAGVAAIL